MTIYMGGPSTGFPGDENKLIGKKIKYNIAQGQIFKKRIFFKFYLLRNTKIFYI